MDNASTTGATPRIVDQARVCGHSVKIVVEHRRGLSWARNAGIRASDGQVIVFTDDDVVVDPGWLTPLRSAFALDPSIGAAVGLVPSADLDLPAQREWDRRLPWSSRLEARKLSTAERRANNVFPFNAGQIGTGANMAFKREVLTTLRCFNTALGAGTYSRGGEDLEMFVRVLLGGWAIKYEPSSIVWHVHQAQMGALRSKVFSYGVGTGAYFTSLLLGRHRRAAALSLPLLLGFAASERRSILHRPRDLSLEALEILGLLCGPLALSTELLRQKCLGIALHCY